LPINEILFAEGGIDMENGIRYVHTNIIARDWRKLAQFYVDVFHCVPVYPERDLAGNWLDRITGIKNARVQGIHLSLPGYENGPTLEIFEYSPDSMGGRPAINCQGLAHLAFHVDSVEAVLGDLLDHGGGQLGELVVQDYGDAGTLTAVYARDPEGNIVEIQNWQR
jgi:catechol 2,3-dioxygenase-like lactoylglutathione lyase family enzyme